MADLREFCSVAALERLAILKLWLLTLFAGSPAEQTLETSQPPDKRAHERRPQDRGALLHWIGEGGSTEEEVRVRDLSPTGFGLVADRALPVGLTVWIADQKKQLLKCVVRHCREESGLYQIGLFQVILERRETDRQPISYEAVLRWSDPVEGEKQEGVRLRNVSKDGFQIESAVAVPEGSSVYLVIHSCKFRCVTRYCTEQGPTFLIGLKAVDEPQRAAENESRIAERP